MSLRFDAKKMFFDRRAVIDAVGRANVKVLSHAGAFIQRRAKSSIRKRKRASRPGEPPSSHVGTLRNLIYFGFDTGNSVGRRGSDAGGHDRPRAAYIGIRRPERRQERTRAADSEKSATAVKSDSTVLVAKQPNEPPMASG